MTELLEADKGGAVSRGTLWKDQHPCFNYYPASLVFLLISGEGLLMMVVMITIIISTTMVPTLATLVQKPSS